ncbi:unnamed protein product [Gongylonema pulchrum]|uniref:Uncharacterized protein n=1 Tax=Gongylonema pulchrum TaxID=637853 RepID=A0A183DKF9_9BILA|nr:unnamed protein product [Gongylonema pulchrum]
MICFQRDCIDKIPKIIKKNQALRMLSICNMEMWTFGEERIRCLGVTESNSNSSFPLVDGVICCCREACTAAGEDSYLDLSHGYFPFEMR